MKILRDASHAGSWYTDDGDRLRKQLDKWLEAATPPEGVTFPVKGAKAIIAPHAGYTYSGATAAYAYRSLDPSAFRRVFILGPSHHISLSGCALSRCTEYETPLGNLVVDVNTVAELKGTGEFLEISKVADEEEHSLEMHLPYIYKIFERVIKDVTIVPIVVGNLSEEKHLEYGRILARYLEDPKTCFVISSDFCHWGGRFSYTQYRAGKGKCTVPINEAKEQPVPIHKSIELIDREGMEIIETLDYNAFFRYCKETRNTICGRKPIGVLLCTTAVILESREESVSSTKKENQRKRSHAEEPELKFVAYAQSSAAKSPKDSSVSYASAYMVI